MHNKNQTSIYKTLKRLLNYVSFKRKIQFLYLVFLTIISSFAEIISIGSVYPFIKTITEPNKIFLDKNYSYILEFLNITTTKELITTSCIFFAILAIFAGLIRVLLTYINLRLAMAVSSDLYLMVYSKILKQPYSYHISKNSNEIISTITNKVSNINSIFNNCITIFSATLIFFSIITILFIINVEVTSYAVLFFFISYLFIIRLSRAKLIRNSKQIVTQQDLIIKAVQEGLGGIRDVIIDKNEKYFIKIYQKAVSKTQKALAQNSFIAQSPRYILESIGLVFIAILILIFSGQNINNIYEILPVLGALGLAAQRMLPLINQIYQAHTNNKGIVYAILDVIEILDKKDSTLLIKENKNFTFNKKILLKKLEFSYKNDNNKVFKNLNFEIFKGSKIAITGASGCGKSTLLDLIMGLLEPTGGTILVDDFPLKENKSKWQSKIAHVPQNIYLTDASITENIAFGVPKEKIDLIAVKEAAKKAQIHDFIESRDFGYNEIVGERGIKLSGGQRQRIGIARALYKKVDLLILDEATSALDNETENSLMKVVDNLDKNLTIIMVAHRQSSLKNCNYFLDLNNLNENAKST
jgi:ATP-binding cassette, subfamily B, bacterial PglK